MNAQIWALLWPDFWQQVYPNILASLIWAVPGFLGQHFAMRRHHRRVLAEHVEAMRRAQDVAAAKQAERVADLAAAAVSGSHEQLVALLSEALAPRPRRFRR